MRPSKIFVLASVIFGCSKGFKQEKGEVENLPKPVVVKVIKPESLSRYIKVVGSIKGYPDVNVFPDMPGRLLELKVSEGQFIRKGQIVALIDRSAPGIDVKPLTVISPASGYVQVLVKDIGSSVGPQTPIIRVVGKAHIYLSFGIPEVFVNKIKRGNRVMVEGYLGEIVKVSPAIDKITRDLPVEATIKGNFIPGQTVVVKVEVERSDSTVVLPVSAFVGEVEKSVFVVKNGRVKKVPVKIGIKTPDGYEVVKGLNFGDTVVVYGVNTLVDGDKVRIMEASNG